MRHYASPVNPASTPPTPASSKQQQQWSPKAPIATAQTLTLFSESPQGLIIALRSTLQGMVSLAERLGPLPNDSPPSSPPSSPSESKTVSKTPSDHVLLYSLSKDLPREFLSEAVNLLREVGGGSSSSPTAKISKVGLLSSALPTSLIPDTVLDPGSPPLSRDTLYSASLSLLPGVNAVPFRSDIPGSAEVAVGRWPERKEAWKRKKSVAGQESSPFREKTEFVFGENGKDWKDVWGKENVEGIIPEGLRDVDPSSVLSVMLYSDPSPQGLLEGLTHHFPSATILGLKAPPTPFETGRDRTMFLSLPTSDGGLTDQIHSDGAVGVALVAVNPGSAVQGNAARSREVSKPKIKIDFEGLKPFGPRREITSARGNIISSLDNENAAQQFLRDIQTRGKDDNCDSREGPGWMKEMTEANARELASKVRKEEDFYMAVYASESGGREGEQEELGGGEPLLLAQILSGHPSRGTLSLDTQVELGPRPGGREGENLARNLDASPTKVGGNGLFAQFLEKRSDTAAPSSNRPSALEIPGPDPKVWSSPRFLFLTLPPSTSEQAAAAATAPKVQAEAESGKSKAAMTKHQVFALPNLFIAASEKGWIAGKGVVADGLHPRSENFQVVECNVPLSRALLSLR
ncbi:hypothetical protein IE53DRAFT_389426 [Violaceomyces palustris]|uniref:Uncharacterized protein n=1 Tax=Violaceomyces palustris TaxID=1673888 RepID=A0ACD0NRC2_9BASI|nr:hypothetical protein IE53DRAFT_389426 [Violaceomyces palustris]